MARPLRIDIEDGLYHVTSRGLERRAIFLDDTDRQKWTSLLAKVAEHRSWRVLAWALMDNHFHLYLRTPHADLSAGMHDLNSGYVSVFNRRHQRCGPLFQGRFKAILVEREQHDWELTRYIHLNPVRAGLVKRPEVYPWSSCAYYFRSRDIPDWLACEEVLVQHGRTLRAARRAYLQFLIEGIFSPPSSPLKDLVASMLLGSPSFMDQMKNRLRDRMPDQEIPATKLLRDEPTIEEIVAAVRKSYRVSPESLTRRGRHDNQARCAAIYLARKLTRTPIKTLGLYFGGIKASAITHTVGQITQRRAEDKQLNSTLSKIEKNFTKN